MSYEYIVFGNGHSGTVHHSIELVDEFPVFPKELVSDRDVYSSKVASLSNAFCYPVRKLVAHGHTYLVVSENEISQEELEATLLRIKQTEDEVKPFE